jgi:hypothetical protein
MIKDHLCDWHGLQISNVMIKVQHYVLKFVSDLQQVGGFLRVLWFPPPMKLAAMVYMKYC